MSSLLRAADELDAIAALCDDGLERCSSAAGRILARAEGYVGYPWIVLAGEPFDDRTTVGDWPQVLGLDPTTDPVPVDLGGQS